jgi:acyl carrier protein
MFEKVVSIMENVLNIDGADITEATDFKDDLGLDSLDLFELVMAFEEEYGIEIPQDDLDNIATVGDVVEYLSASEDL